MDKNNEIWWLPEAGFFGEFYQTGDFSLCGFNSTLILSHQERTEREIEFIRRYLNPKKGAKILDCPCGYGRHSLILGTQGFKITGVDINEFFLMQCRKQASLLKIEENCTFINQDMLNLSLGKTKFDYILNLFTSFGFFWTDSENRKVLDNFYSVLKSGGKLMLYFDYNATRILNKQYFKGDENKRRECLFNGKTYELFVHETYDKNTKRLNGSWKIRNGVPVEPIEKTYSIRIYSNSEIEDLLKDVGFKKVEFYDPANEIFDMESKETIIIAIK